MWVLGIELGPSGNTCSYPLSQFFSPILCILKSDCLLSTELTQTQRVLVHCEVFSNKRGTARRGGTMQLWSQHSARHKGKAGGKACPLHLMRDGSQKQHVSQVNSNNAFLFPSLCSLTGNWVCRLLGSPRVCVGGQSPAACKVIQHKQCLGLEQP